MSVSDKVQEFKARQTKIIGLNDEYNQAMDKVNTEFDDRLAALKNEFELKKAETSAELDKETAAYKADMKAAFGVTDGERTNILDVVELITRVARD
jgi:uncharacterized small protein (DUF1192 family)